MIKRSQIIYHPTFVPELTSASPDKVTVGSMKIISQQQQTLRRWRNNWNESFLTIVRLVPFLHRPFLTYMIADRRNSSTALDAYKMALHSRFIWWNGQSPKVINEPEEKTTSFKCDTDLCARFKYLHLCSFLLMWMRKCQTSKQHVPAPQFFGFLFWR